MSAFLFEAYGEAKPKDIKSKMSNFLRWIFNFRLGPKLSSSNPIGSPIFWFLLSPQTPQPPPPRPKPPVCPDRVRFSRFFARTQPFYRVSNFRTSLSQSARTRLGLPTGPDRRRGPTATPKASSAAAPGSSRVGPQRLGRPTASCSLAEPFFAGR